jgi:hypothetical protein
MHFYAGDNEDFVIPARRNDVQVALNEEQRTAANALGLALNTNSVKNIWSCPSRPPVYPKYEPPPLNQYVIGYMYFGGITNWYWPSRGMRLGRSWSPVKVSTSRPHWALAADSIIKDPNLAWGQFSPGDADREIFHGIPPHRSPQGGGRPTGGNQLMIDGHGEWVKVDRLRMLHTWSGNRLCYWYQDWNADHDMIDLLKRTLNGNTVAPP